MQIDSFVYSQMIKNTECVIINEIKMTKRKEKNYDFGPWKQFGQILIVVGGIAAFALLYALVGMVI